MFLRSFKPIYKCTYISPIILNRNFAKGKDPFFEAIIDILEPKETLYNIWLLVFDRDDLPKELQERATVVFAKYNKEYQKRDFRRRADIDNKIYLMHKAVDALPTNHLRELARLPDTTPFPKERFMLTTLPPPFKEYEDETGEGYQVFDKKMQPVDLKSLGVTVWDVIDAQKSNQSIV